MSGLSQIQASFSDIEDRILLRMNTVLHEEFRFWLTRRFVSRLYPIIMETIETIPEIAAQDSPINREAIMNFQREHAAQKADFSVPFIDDENITQYPLGKEGILVVRGKLQQTANNNFELSLKDKHNKGIDFSFNTDILYLLQTLLRDTLQKADWDLALTPYYSQSLATEPAQRTLN